VRTYDNDESVGKRKFRSFIRRNVKMSDDASHLSISAWLARWRARAGAQFSSPNESHRKARKEK
jgi:hypothetical protein